MHRFENEVVVLAGSDLFDERFSNCLRPDAIVEELMGVRAPLTEIVVDIDRGHSGRLGAFLQASELGCDRQRLTENLLAVGILKVIDDIDENEHSRRMVRSLSGWHRPNPEEWCGAKARGVPS